MNKPEFAPTGINRCVVMLIPKKPFYDWVNAHIKAGPLFDENEVEYTSFLIDIDSDIFDPKDALKEHWSYMFEYELGETIQLESTWPQNRTWEMFQDWFTLKFSTVVIDLLNEPVYKLEY